LIIQDILSLMKNHIQHIFSIISNDSSHPFWWGKWNIYTTL